MKRKLALCLLLLSATAQTVWAQGSDREQAPHVSVAGRDVAYWKPKGTAPAAGYPLIVFSHGYGGCNTQSVFLMEALAKAGYLVLAPNHKDARCGSARKQEGGWYPGKLLKESRSRQPEEPFEKAEEWSDATYRDRDADFEAILDAALKARSFEGVAIDSQRVGIAGHSLGGYTVLGLAGAWPSWKDTRVKAVLAMSPYSYPYLEKGNLGQMNVPVMYQGGTRDFGVTPSVKKNSGAYDKSSAPKYFVNFDGAGHFAWTDLVKSYQGLICEYSVLFFDQYLKQAGRPGKLAELTKNPPPKGVREVKVTLR